MIAPNLSNLHVEVSRERGSLGMQMSAWRVLHAFQAFMRVSAGSYMTIHVEIPVFLLLDFLMQQSITHMLCT